MRTGFASLLKIEMPLSDKKKKPHVVIVGGGFGGLNTAKHLKHSGALITLIDKKNHHLFQPLLYQVATAGLSSSDIAVPIRRALRNQANTQVLMGEVTGIDTQTQQVLLSDKSIPFDYLVIATGSTHSYFNHKEWEPYAPGVKSLTDAVRIRTQILTAFEKAEFETDLEKKKKLLTFVLIGAGPTGVEMAGALADLVQTALKKDFKAIHPSSTRIILLEANTQILTTFPRWLAAKAQRYLENVGVEIRTQSPVLQINEHGVTVKEEIIHCETVIWTAGVQASSAGLWLRAETDRAGRVKVLNDLSVPGHPQIYVIGDTASPPHQNGKPLPGLASVALQQGCYVAKLIKQKLIEENSKAPLTRTNRKPFWYHDRGNLATLGRTSAIVDLKWVRLNGWVGWIIWAIVHIFYLITFRNRILVMIKWSFLYLAHQQNDRLILVPTLLNTSRSKNEKSQEAA